MKNARVVVVAALMAAAVGSVPAAERAPVDRSDIQIQTLDYQARFHTSFAGGPAVGVDGILLNESGDNHLLHRVLMDKARGLYYGYDIRIENAEGGFDVKIGPLGPEADRYFVESRWKELCPACPAPERVQAAQRFPAPRRVHAGDTLSVDLLEDARGGVVTDQVTVSAGLVPTSPETRPLRVFAPIDLDPKAVLIQLADPRLLADGQTAWDMGGNSVQGHVVWVDLPGHGRVFVTLAPLPQCALQKIGVVAGDTITFTLDGIKYEWISKGPIVTAGPVSPFNSVQSWNVWGFHDKDWRPFQGKYTEGAGETCPSPAKVS